MQDYMFDANYSPSVIVKFATDEQGKVNTYIKEKDIARVVRYVCQEDKETEEINLDYTGGNGVSYTDYKKAAKDIKKFQKKAGKDTGRRIYHLIISFAYVKEPQVVYEIVERICGSFFADYQYIFNVHTKTENLHAHICIGSVGICTPHKKIHFSKKEGLELLGDIKDLAAELLNPDYRANFYDGFR